MAYKLITSSQVERDVEKAIEWYLAINIDLARRFLKEVRTTRNYIQKNPEKFQVRYNNVRIAFLKKFPFGMHFRFENDTVTILAVFHFKQNPKNWERL